MKMILAFFAFVCILKSSECTSCEDTFRRIYIQKTGSNIINKFQNPVIHLINTNEPADRLGKFVNLVNLMRFSLRQVESFCHNKTEETEIVAKYFQNVVNLNLRYVDTNIKNMEFIGFSKSHIECFNKSSCHDGDCRTSETTDLIEIPEETKNHVEITTGITDHVEMPPGIPTETQDHDKTLTETKYFIEIPTETIDHDEKHLETTDYYKISIADSSNKTVDSYKIDNNCSENNKFREVETAIAVSKNIMRKYKDFIELLKNIDYPEYDYLWKPYFDANLYKNKVIVCADDNPEYEKNNARVKIIKDCRLADFYNSNILGIIARRPEGISTIVPAPIIFYGVSEILQGSNESYPNSAVINENENKYLAKAAIKLIETAGWQRIAILSDISPYSLKFELYLRKALIEKKIIHTVKQCGYPCDFYKELQELHDAYARIVFVNVDEEYAHALLKAAQYYELNSEAGYMWIWRGWPFKNDEEVRAMGEVYSLNVLSENTNSVAYNDLALISIQQGIDAFSWNKTKRYRKILTAIKTKLSEKEPKAVVLRKVALKVEKIFTCDIQDFKCSMDKQLRFTDLPPRMCTVRSNKFEDPCDDYKLLTLLLILFGFIIVAILFFMFCNPFARLRKYNIF